MLLIQQAHTHAHTQRLVTHFDWSSEYGEGTLLCEYIV